MRIKSNGSLRVTAFNPKTIRPKNLRSSLPRHAMRETQFRNIIVFGPPGVGKGAQAGILSACYSLAHLSTGELIRQEIKEKTVLGLRVSEAVARGEFADDETVLSIIMRQIDSPDLEKGFVMDGFPRTIRQAEKFDELLKDRQREIDCVLSFDASEEVILERLSGRTVCSKCGATYHKQFKPPRVEGICDVCRGKVVQRHDDTPAVHKTRLAAYYEKTKVLEEYYGKSGVLHHVDAAESIEEVAKTVARIVAAPVEQENEGEENLADSEAEG